MILNKSFMQGFLYSKTDIGLYRLNNMSYEELLKECKEFIGFRNSVDDRLDFRQDPDWKLTLDEEIDLDEYCLVKENTEVNTVDSLWSHQFKPVEHSSDTCSCDKRVNSTWEEEAQTVLIKPDKYKDIRVHEDSVLSDIIDAVIHYKGINGIVEDLTETQILSITLDVIYKRIKKSEMPVSSDDMELAIECANKMINIYGDSLIPSVDNDPLPGYKRYDIPMESVLCDMVEASKDIIEYSRHLDNISSINWNTFIASINSALNSKKISYHASKIHSIDAIINKLRSVFYSKIERDTSSISEDENYTTIVIPKNTIASDMLRELFNDYSSENFPKTPATALRSISRAVKTAYTYGPFANTITDDDKKLIETAIEAALSINGLNFTKSIPIYKYSTKELFDELCTRGGVETHWVAPETNYEFRIKNSIETCHQDVIYKGNGPLWITFNYD